MAPFEETGCAEDEFGGWTCPEDGPIAVLGCDAIASPDDLLGALDPAYPLARCLYYPTRHQQENPDALNEERLFNAGCLLPVHVRYVISRDGQFVSINNLAELQETYAPLESPEEALSFALAATGLEAKFGLQRQANFRYFVDQLEDTHTEEVDGDYEILLYHYQVCGCGPHTTSAVLLRVSRDGDVQETSTTPAYENPEEDGLCVD
jgi:hypothetical protein